MNKLSVFLFLISCSIYANKNSEQLALINPELVHKSHQIKNAQLLIHGDKFFVKNENNLSLIKTHDVDQLLKKIGSQKLPTFLKHGYLQLNQCTNGDYTLKANVRGVGGGPITGSILYWLTKTVCYGTAVAAAGTAVVATGGAAGAAGGAIAAASTLGASSGATILGGAIAGAGLTTQAATATAGVVACSGSVAAAVGAVETASMGAFAVGLAIPFLP